MSFLNLNLGELLGLIGAISAGVVALYLLDRSKRRQMVATLRFWSAADVRTELKHRRRIQQPWSLILQLISLALLLAALAGPQLGGIIGSSRDHVLILDTSAWMGVRARAGTLMDEAKATARNYLKSLPASDRVMVVRADALATPVTAFESNRGVVEDAIRRSQPSASKLNLEQAFEFAQRVQRQQSQKSGEMVFAGAGRVSDEEAAFAAVPQGLRVLPTSANQENVGLRKIGLRRSPKADATWDIYVVLRNYGARPHDVDLGLQFGGAPAGERRISLKPGAEEQATFTYHTKAAGYLEARIRSVDGKGDVFPQDDRAVIELPGEKALRVAVYSTEPDSLRPLFANAQVDAFFETPAAYDPNVKADIVVLDRFAPPAKPAADSIWIEPPAEGSPVTVKGKRSGIKLEGWRQETTLGAGLHTKDVQLASGEVFAAAPNDISVAESADGPLVVARPGQSQGQAKVVVIGFNPVKSTMKYELATPLLMANIVRWMAPETFRRREVQAGTVGTVSVALDKGTDPSSIRVLTDDQRPVPFTVESDTLRFFAGAPGTVRVLMGDRELVYSLTLPDVGEAVWRAPQGVKRGVPKGLTGDISATDLWPWLAILGGLGLLIDWLLFGRSRSIRLRAAGAAVMRKVAFRKAS